MPTSATSTNLSNQFIRQFPVAIDRDMVFQTTSARTNYLTDIATSGIAYTGMIVADNETKKAYILVSNNDVFEWEEIGASTVNDLFTGSGFMIKTSEDNFRVGGLDSGFNISIDNASGLTNNPIINLSSSLTGLNSIGVTGNGIDVSGASTFYNDVNVTGNLNVSGNVTIGGSNFSQSNVTLINLSATSGNFTNGLTVNNTSVSLSGHQHVWSDINIVAGDGFCDDVASCVNTPLAFTNGIGSSFADNTLTIALTGQASGLHNMSNNGFFVRNNNSIVSRSIEPSGSNIIVGSGNGQDGNPTIGLSSNINVSNIYVGNDVDITGNLYVKGDSIIANVSVIEVEDPTIRLGKPSGINLETSDVLDRGVEFVYQTGDAVAITGFFGFDHSNKFFTFIPTTTNTANSVYAGDLGTIKIGRLWSTGLIGGNSDSERATLQYCNIDGGSPGTS